MGTRSMKMRYSKDHQSSFRTGAYTNNPSSNYPLHQPIVVSVLLFFIVSIGFFVLASPAPTQNKFHNTNGASSLIGKGSETMAESTSLSSMIPVCEDTIHYKLVDSSKKNDDGSHTHVVNGETRFVRYAAYCGDQQPVSVETWTKNMAWNSGNHPSVLVSLVNIIRQSEFQGVFFETKGCHANNWNTQQFEFVLVDAPELKSFAETNPDPNAFAEHFKNSCRNNDSSDVDACAFDNLGRDARLIAPIPKTSKHIHQSCYSHLAAFCRSAPQDQVLRVWSKAAQELERRILNTSSQNPSSTNTTGSTSRNHHGGTPTKPPPTTWFSTSGMGIAWLHFRLDSRPKYYQYTPFKKE